MDGELREQLGRIVRETWVSYCIETGDTKLSHIAPWDDLSEWDREADRRIGEAIIAVLPPAITAEQWEALGVVLAYVEGWNAVDRPVLRPDAQKMRDAVALLRALATGQPS
jgi:hypothetical protein